MELSEPDCKFISGLLAGNDLDDASRSLKAISHPLRLKILCILGKGESSVQDIVESVGTSQSNVSQHLGIMRDKGVITSRKDANKVFYHVNNETILRLMGMKPQSEKKMN
jgi:ArsR family transcriptional regulator